MGFHQSWEYVEDIHWVCPKWRSYPKIYSSLSGENEVLDHGNWEYPRGRVARNDTGKCLSL